MPILESKLKNGYLIIQQNPIFPYLSALNHNGPPLHVLVTETLCDTQLLIGWIPFADMWGNESDYPMDYWWERMFYDEMTHE